MAKGRVNTGGGGGGGLPEFTYTGTYSFIDDGDKNWRIKFLTSGTLVFTTKPPKLDIFLVGGGGDGNGQGGGGGGYTATFVNETVFKDTEYPIVIGGSCGNTEGFSHTALAGARGTTITYGGDGGSGGGESGGKVGGSDGGDGGGINGGTGQGATTREFGEANGTLYAGGGGGGDGSGGGGGAGGGGKGGKYVSVGLGENGKGGKTNTGGGGGGGGRSGNGNPGGVAGIGGSGILIIRNNRSA